MDKKIIKIILIILIFILLFFNIEALQRHLINKKINSTNIKIEQFIKNETGIYIGYKDDKYIRGLEEFYKEYKGNISKDELQRVLYNFTNQTLKNMRDMLVGKSQEEIKKIYNSYSPVPHEMVAFYTSEIELIKQIGDFLSFSLYNFLKNNFIYIHVLYKSENKLIIELEFRQYAVKRLTMEKYSVGQENAMYRCIEVDGELIDFITFRDDLLKYLSDFLRTLW